MPHQVVKLAVHGSVGDLAKITGVVKDLDLNVLAIGGGEAPHDDGEIGIVSMIVEPDGEAETNELVTRLRALQLDNGRSIADLEVIPNVHLALANKVGELNRALAAIGNVNIRAIVSLGDFLGESHVALGFAVGDLPTVIQRLTDAGIRIVPPEDEEPQSA
jgi:hypothetical protein